jgi:hypothetical protein
MSKMIQVRQHKEEPLATNCLHGLLGFALRERCRERLRIISAGHASDLNKLRGGRLFLHESFNTDTDRRSWIEQLFIQSEHDLSPGQSGASLQERVRDAGTNHVHGTTSPLDLVAQ